MLVHAIIDYSYLYYKYKFQLESGRIRRLTTSMNWHGTVIEKDISQIYYSLKEIEGFRHKLESIGHKVIVSVCFDMPSARKQLTDTQAQAEQISSEASDKYKSNRVKRLDTEDFENIQLVESLLSIANHNTYRFTGYEADDIVAHLVSTYSNNFDYTVIYTPDLDLLAHINPKVGVSRYKAKKGYANIDINNFSTYLSEELKCEMPYNALILYKATVGDKSDCIDGIKKFGPKAFDKLVSHLSSSNIDWSSMGNTQAVESTLIALRDTGYFTTEQLNQALESLSLVRPMVFERGTVPTPLKVSTQQFREQAYLPYGMKSLIE